MNLKKKIGIILLVVFVGIQFIQPAHNKSEQMLSTDISKTIAIPANVQTVLQVACYDCHSNNTNYPWYSNIQPVGWILNQHIQNGKKELNFSDFGSYSIRRQQSKLKSIVSQINDGDMPLSSYTLVHKNARLTKNDKALFISWAQQSLDSLSVKNQQ